MGDFDSLIDRKSDFRGWTLEILKIVIELGKKDFSLREIYAYESYLKELYPSNNTIQAQIRKQLQILRDEGILEFHEQGHYRVICGR
ncbi:hypothetical protein MNBD_DELTA01-397 [hydrothermal vent metagenome]|uniref:Dam-replacing protein HTH domain-containing protein n=1 Tax=hydrothermal vent metagenome TaxID=652676 RepID=A0A3B0QUG4_9ZZZZ